MLAESGYGEPLAKKYASATTEEGSVGVALEPPFILDDDEFAKYQRRYYFMKKQGKYNLTSDERSKYEHSLEDAVKLQMVLLSEVLGHRKPLNAK